MGGISLWWARIRFPLGALVGWVSIAIGIVGGAGAIIAGLKTSQDFKDSVWGITLAVITCISFSAFAYQHLKRFRARAIASTITQQARASDILRETRNYLRSYAIEFRRTGVDVPNDVLPRARQRIEEALTEYAGVFSATTGTRCRLAVKLVRIRQQDAGQAPTEADFFLYTLARDALSASENIAHDKRRADELLDPLSANSDFLMLWSPERADDGTFYSDNLTKERDHETSSANYRLNVQDNLNKPGKKDWPLWYISTIVWPIRQGRNDALGISQPTNHDFLAVDSRAPYAFDRDVHVAMGRMLANSLFPVIDLYTELVS